MPQNMWNIRGRVCEIWSEQVWLLGLKLCLLWIPLIPVAHLSRSSVSLTHSQHEQNSQPVSKLNEICAFVYPILVIPRWGRQTIHYITLSTGIGAKISHVACHTGGGEEQNREEGEMAQTKLGGGRNRGKKEGGGRKRNVTV